LKKADLFSVTFFNSDFIRPGKGCTINKLFGYCYHFIWSLFRQFNYGNESFCVSGVSPETSPTDDRGEWVHSRGLIEQLMMD
jgi:hypothetical protein